MWTTRDEHYPVLVMPDRVRRQLRRTDHSGWAKAGWFIVILFIPVLGVFIYLIARPAEVPA
jgi:Phospholipase_D-nuclease N-terminal